MVYHISKIIKYGHFYQHGVIKVAIRYKLID